ncbi:beta,beta-carotene 15,15'-monooxygenase [Platysternon megacephalum]|uniref:Nucleoside diphosphate kinase homolog 5 n=2 Tax=Testudinoidea TaxID=8486 RepID=A0A4D9EGJ1_9SAUR|nr:beta,beta-carotene 15,15'-monooxygenase [Platysternon megacephalum]
MQKRSEGQGLGSRSPPALMRCYGNNQREDMSGAAGAAVPPDAGPTLSAKSAPAQGAEAPNARLARTSADPVGGGSFGCCLGSLSNRSRGRSRWAEVREKHWNFNLEAKMQALMPEPQIYVERTLALIKPDVIDKEEEIEDIILRSGFTIVQKRKLQLSPEQCSNFYADQYGKMFFPNLTAYMSSGPLVAMVLARHNAIAYWKELIGPSNSIRAKETYPDSLRAIYGTDDLRNAVHGSIRFSSAEREIRFMFPEVIIEPIPVGQAAKDYLNLYVNPTLLAGLTELCKQKPADPLIWFADWLIEHNPNKPRLQQRMTVEEP